MAYENFKLGRLPRPNDAKFLKLGGYCKKVLPAGPPKWDGTTGAVFRMYKNDEYGNCTCVSIANLASLQYAGSRVCVGYTDDEVVKYYFDMTGGKDEGAIVVDVLKHLSKKGFPANGSYKIAGFAAVDHTCLDTVKSAANIFRGLYVGADLPISAQTEKTWDVVKGRNGDPGSWGGHAMTLVGYDAKGVSFATWGRIQRATWAWWNRYVDESYAILDVARRGIDKAKDAINWQKLIADMKALR